MWKKLDKTSRGGGKFTSRNNKPYVIVRKGGQGFYITTPAHALIGEAKRVAIYNDGNGNFAFVPTDHEEDGYVIRSHKSLPTIAATVIVRDNHLADEHYHRIYEARRENVNGINALVFDSRNRPELMS